MATLHELLPARSIKSSEKADLSSYKTPRHKACEFLWKEYFRDPSQWWDNRKSKPGSTFPDFKHKASKQCLWLNSRFNPPWVLEELTTREPSVPAEALNGHLCELDGNVPLVDQEVASFVSLLRACSKNKDLNTGTQLHDDIVQKGLLDMCSDALVTMYARCGALAKAQELLDRHKCKNAVSWTALIAGYARQGKAVDAFNCFQQMQHEGLSPDAVTFASVLKACGALKAADKGKEIHDQIDKLGLLGHDVVLGNALVDMYTKCGALAKAQEVFDELPVRDVVSWNALITGYSQQGQGEQALNCFERMQHEGLTPNASTFASILKVCGTMGAADKGEQIHDKIAKEGLLGKDAVLGNALVDMYAKCGALEKARQVLEQLPIRNLHPWTALIAGYAQQGKGEEALKCFELMQCDGLSPDAVAFSCVLNACSHLGLVEDGHKYFLSISAKYGMKPDFEHYTCMVDLFGRAGHFNKAVEMIEEMPSLNCVGVWSSLLGACQKWGEVNVARWAFDQALQVEKSDSSVYILMANIYVAAGMEEDAKMVEALRMENEAWKASENE